jgi:two-component system, OmpR family, response regulator CpxR
VNSSPTILSVDDETNGLLIRKAILKLNGYRVLTARNCPEALYVFNSTSVDLVISDHFLSGETGCELARRLKEINPDIPVMLLSGATEMPAEAACADVFLSKLEGPVKMLQVTAQLLTGKFEKVG